MRKSGKVAIKVAEPLKKQPTVESPSKINAQLIRDSMRSYMES